jgi:hypothetical protein
VGAFALLVAELAWVRPFPPRPFFGWPIGVSTAALAAAMLVVPSVIALCRRRITESAEYLRIGYSLLGVEWGEVDLRKIAVAEVAIHGTPKRASFFSPDRELLVRTNETGVRLGGELDASGLGWLEDAVRTMVARR